MSFNNVSDPMQENNILCDIVIIEILMYKVTYIDTSLYLYGNTYRLLSFHP